jgi:hypothetical protein
MLCSWVFQFAEPHCRDGLDDLLFSTALMWWTWWSAILAVKFHIPWFQALLWLASRGFYIKGDWNMDDCHVFTFVVFMDIKTVDLVRKEWQRVWHHCVAFMKRRNWCGGHRLKWTRYL